MSVAFLHRLFETLPILAEELGADRPAWWAEVKAHLPRYNTIEVTDCRQAAIGQPHCYNQTRCPCAQQNIIMIAAKGLDAHHRPVPNSTLIGGAYSNWPAFPSEHVDVDSSRPAAGLAAATAATLFDVGGGSIGVYGDCDAHAPD